MLDLFDDEHKGLDEVYNRLRELLARLEDEKKPLRAVKPNLLVTSTGEAGSPDAITACLVVLQVTGPDSLAALKNLESALRISALGVLPDVSDSKDTLVDVEIEVPQESARSEPEVSEIGDVEETATLADVRATVETKGRSLH